MPKGECTIWNSTARKEKYPGSKLKASAEVLCKQPAVLCFEETRAVLHRDPDRLRPKSAQRFNRSGPMFGTMVSEWSWLTFRLKIPPPPLLTPRGPTNAPSLPPFPESVSANPRCLRFRPLPPPYCFTPNTCTTHSSHSAVHLCIGTTARARIYSPGCQAANQRAAVRIRALSDSWNRPGLHLADAAHHPPLTAEVKLLLLPCARRQPPKRT